MTLTDNLQFCANADAVPSVQGAYILRVDLVEPVPVTMSGQPSVELPVGSYLCCGSTYGPGGLKCAFLDVPNASKWLNSRSEASFAGRRIFVASH